MSDLLSQVGANHAGKSLRPPWVQRSLLPRAAAPVRVPSVKHIHAMAREVAEGRSRVQPKHGAVKAAEPAAAKEVAVVNVSSAPPAPTIFQAIGYVEKGGGQREAIILQENQVQVVHIGDLIAGRFRVTKFYPDSVDAIDETLVQSPMAKPNGAKSNELTASVAQQPSTPPVAVAPAQPEALAVAAESDQPARIQGVEPVSLASAAIAPAPPTTPSSAVRENRIAPPQRAEPVANCLGYVQQSDGKVETIVADGESVRLVPETPAVAMAQVTPPRSSQEDAPPTQDPTPPAVAVSSTKGEMADHSVHRGGLPDAPVIRQASYQIPPPVPAAAEGPAPLRIGVGSVGEAVAAVDAASASATPILAATPAGSTDRLAKLPVKMKPLGFVEKADGEFDAILSQDDEIYIVRQGDRFAGRYRAVSVSADAVEAVEDPPRQPLPPHPDTFVFQTLGYVETKRGETRAIVADGSQVYLVKQGETFADQYWVTSVDPILVLAVRVSPGQHVGNFLSAQTESGGNPASKKLYGYLHYPLLGWANAQAFHEVDASGGPVLMDLGVNLLNSPLTWFDVQEHFFTADNPNGGF